MPDFYQIPLDLPKASPEYQRWEKLNFVLRQIFELIGNIDGRQGPMEYLDDLDMSGHQIANGPIMTTAQDRDFVTKSYFRTAEFGKMAVTLLASTGKTPLPITGSTGTPSGGSGGGGGGGTSDHAALLNLAYAASGHSGFVPDTRTISTTAPLTGGGNLSADRTIAIPAASGASDGYLTAADWTTFNSKLSGAVGNLTEATSAVLTITGGTGAVIGAGTSIEVKQADGAQAGYLSAADWTTFNGKQNALSFGNLTEATSSVMTITGGTGAVIGAGTTIEIKQASGAQAGYLSAADWTTFNGKQNALSLGNLTEATSAVLTITGGTGAVVGNVSIQVAAASGAQAGYLSAADWTTFNNKASASGTSGIIAKFTGANALGDSIIKEDSSKIGVGTTGAPGYKLEVEGQIKATSGSIIPAAVITLADAASITTDASLGNTFIVTLGGDRTLANPTNMVDGQRCIWLIEQDGTGSRALSLGSKFNIGTDIIIDLSVDAGAIDMLGAWYYGAADQWIVTGFLRGY